MARNHNPIITTMAIRLRNAGWRFEEIASVCGCHPDTVRIWFNPKYAEARKRRARELSECIKEHPTAFKDTQIERDARKLMAQIPEDTRDLTSRLCGDPLPGRSALDRHFSVERLCISLGGSRGYDAQVVK